MRGNRSSCSALHVHAERAELRIETLVSAVQVVDLFDNGGALSNEGREHYRGASADIEGANAGAMEGRRSADDSGGAGAHDFCAHLSQLADIEHAVVEYPFMNDRDSVGLRQKGGHRGVKVGCQSRVGQG